VEESAATLVQPTKRDLILLYGALATGVCLIVVGHCNLSGQSSSDTRRVCGRTVDPQSLIPLQLPLAPMRLFPIGARGAPKGDKKQRARMAA
jgi:hypothetical protein